MFKKSNLGAGTLAIVGVLFIGIMLLANLLLRGAQIDLTKDKLYTISDGTKHIIGELKEPVNLYLFFSEKTATPIPQIKNHGVRVRELLEELVLEAPLHLCPHVAQALNRMLEQYQAGRVPTTTR